MKQKGSFTIEAAILMPLLILIIWLLIQISFFLYNRHAITVIASQAALRGVQMETEGKQSIEKSLQSFLKEETEEKLLYTDSVCWEIKITMTKIKVKISLSQKTIYRVLWCETEKEMSRLQPASLLWEAERWKSE